MNNGLIMNFTRFLIKLPEHTWGLPGVNDNKNWKNIQFEKVKNSKDFVMQTDSWIEQRKFIDYSIDALGNHPLK